MTQQDVNHQQQCRPGWVRIGISSSVSLSMFYACLLLLVAEQVNAGELKLYEFLQIRMGIPVKISLYAPSEARANQASRAAFDRIRAIDRTMSDYDPDSELMQLCRTAEVGQPQQVSEELFEVLHESQTLSEKTDGSFDVTVGPLIKLWRIARRRKQLPDSQRLAEASEKVGFEALHLNNCHHTVTLTKPGIQIDLGGIAKGYAADQALAILQQHGITRALIDAGGDLVAGDPPPDRDAWRIQVEQLRNKDEESTPIILRLKNNAVATSGDAYQYLEIDGKRYSHLVNPKTGLGLTTPSTVTVIAPTGMQADSLASAVSVLGADAGLKLLNDIPGTAALIMIQNNNGQIQMSRSDSFDSYLSNRSNTGPEGDM